MSRSNLSSYLIILSSLFQVRKRNPSPSPSAASSSSSTPSHYSHGTEDKRLQYLAGAPNKFGKFDTSAQQTLNSMFRSVTITITIIITITRTIYSQAPPVPRQSRSCWPSASRASPDRRLTRVWRGRPALGGPGPAGESRRRPGGQEVLRKPQGGQEAPRLAGSLGARPGQSRWIALTSPRRST